MRLQKAPRGLLGSLDLKTDGVNPTGFADDIRGSFDVADYYGLPNLQPIVVTGTLTNLGDTISITVPANEVWRVHTLGLRITLTAGDAFGGFLAWRTTSGTVVNPFESNPGSIFSGAVAVTGNVAIATRFARPLLCPPGMALLAYCSCAIGAGRSASLNAMYERFPA